jgi:signal transduction histidine kinase
VTRDPSHLLDAAVPLVVGAVIAVGVVARADAGTRPLALALGLAAAATLALRRRAPTATLAVSSGLVLMVFHVDRGAGAVAVLAPAVALYSVALTRGRLHTIAAALAAVAAVAAADVFLADHNGFQTLGHIALVAVPLLAAEALRNRRSYIKVLLEQLELAERTREEEAQRRAEQERLQIARDLHDVVAHTLTTINVQAGVAAHLLDCDPGNTRTALATIEAASHDALDELRTILGVLREPDGASAPLVPAPDLTSVAELLQQARDTGLEASLKIDGEEPQRVPHAVQLAAFRIVQESLTNARQHAPGASAQVTLTFQPQRLVVKIESGSGASRNGGGGRPGIGILGMRERATALGGTLEAGPSRNGFRVVAALPYRRGP